MKRVVIFGVSLTCQYIERYLDYEKVQIVAYSDNDERKWGGL